MGGGDVKLISASALWMGPQHILPFLTMVALLGGLIAVCLIAVRLVVRRALPQHVPSPPSRILKLTLKWATSGHLPYAVPIGIATRSLLPKIKEDISYLQDNNFKVFSNNVVVDPATIDWQSLSRKRFPYTLRQEPGPNNALGRVKFIFPNKHFVFLHDTPSRGLFGRAERTFSSGCIRVENPFELAELLLNDADNWDADAIQATVDSRQTRRVNLRQPFPVLILYLTAVVDPREPPRFMKDVYNRDPALLEALNGDIEIDIPVAAAAN